MSKATKAGNRKPAATDTEDPVAFVAGFKLVRTAPRRAAAVALQDSATVLVPKIGQALNQPGIARSAVFKSTGRRVYAYSADPGDPSQVVRESADGTRQVGRLKNGKFVPLRKKAA